MKFQPVLGMDFGASGGKDPASSFAHPLAGQQYADMVILRDAESARCSSWDSSGKNADFRYAGSGQTLEIANIEGAGCVRHLYFTIGTRPHYLYDLTLRMYWDGSETPCVEVPFGDFFGMRYERVRFFQSSMIALNQGAGGPIGTIGFNAYFPMPFAKGARITLTNEGAEPVGPVWYHVDYEKLPFLPDDAGRFHAQWRRENPTTAIGPDAGEVGHDGANLDGKENYVILEAEGHGNIAGYFLHIDNIMGGWYGEGDDMIFIDGEEWPPSIHGTGTEEIFGGGACPNSEYIGHHTGYLRVANPDFSGRNSMFRFYLADPIRFRKSIRMTIEHGHANNFANDYSSTVFWYQNEPHAPFPKLPPVHERYPRERDDPTEQAIRAFQEFSKRVSELRRKGREKTGETPPLFKTLSRERLLLSAAIENRREEWVIQECQRLTAEIAAEEGRLGIA